MTCIRKIWIISVTKTSVIYTKSFPVMEKKAIEIGAQTLKGMKEKDFAIGVFRALGLEKLSERMEREDRGLDAMKWNSNPGDFSNLDTDSDSYHGRTFSTGHRWTPGQREVDNDDLEMNQMPVLQVTVDGNKLWPILVVEGNGFLFCAMPLIQPNKLIHSPSSKSKDSPLDPPSKSKDSPLCQRPIVELIEISMTHSLIQEIMKNVSSEADLRMIEELLINILPLGRYLVNEPVGECLSSISLSSTSLTSTNLSSTSLSSTSLSETPKKETSIVQIKIDEKLLPLPEHNDARAGHDVAFGTLTVINNQAMADGAEIIVTRKGLCNNFDVILSSDCCIKDTDAISIKLTKKAPKYFHFLIKENHETLSDGVSSQRLFTHAYKVIKVSPKLIKLELKIEIDKQSRNQRFKFFSVNWREGFIRNSCKVIKSDLNHGSLSMDPKLGLLWSLGQKFPTSGTVIFTGEITLSNQTIDAGGAFVNFKIQNNYRNFLCISRSNISFTPQVDRDAKLLIHSTLMGIDIKLIPDKE